MEKGKGKRKKRRRDTRQTRFSFSPLGREGKEARTSTTELSLKHPSLIYLFKEKKGKKGGGGGGRGTDRVMDSREKNLSNSTLLAHFSSFISSSWGVSICSR